MYFSLGFPDLTGPGHAKHRPLKAVRIFRRKPAETNAGDQGGDKKTGGQTPHGSGAFRCGLMDPAYQDLRSCFQYEKDHRYRSNPFHKADGQMDRLHNKDKGAEGKFGDAGQEGLGDNGQGA